jgi:hypothetical protein
MLITNVAAAVAVDAAAAAAAALPAITLSVGSSLDKISTLRTPFWSETIGVPFGRPSSGLTSVLSEIQKTSHPTSGKQSISGDTLVARALDTDEDAVDPRCVVQKGFCVVRHLQLCRRLSYAPRRPLPICNLQFAGSNRPF